MLAAEVDDLLLGRVGSGREGDERRGTLAHFSSGIATTAHSPDQVSSGLATHPAASRICGAARTEASTPEDVRR